jgi:hypothetical protein
MRIMRGNGASNLPLSQLGKLLFVHNLNVILRTAALAVYRLNYMPRDT